MPWIMSINQTLKGNGIVGIGPISKNGMPLYLGRIMDDKNKIKLPPKPKTFYNKANK